MTKYLPRFKDVLDMFYFIERKMLDKETVKQCIEMLGIDIENTCETIMHVFDNELYKSRFLSNKDKWIDADYKTIITTILNYIKSI